MPRHHFTNGLSAAQYLTYLLAGALYFSAFGVMMGEIGSAFGIGALFVPLILGGYLPALSLLTPRVAAIIAFVFSNGVKNVAAAFAGSVSQGLTVEDVAGNLAKEFRHERRERGGR